MIVEETLAGCRSDSCDAHCLRCDSLLAPCESHANQHVNQNTNQNTNHLNGSDPPRVTWRHRGGFDYLPPYDGPPGARHGKRSCFHAKEFIKCRYLPGPPD